MVERLSACVLGATFILATCKPQGPALLRWDDNSSMQTAKPFYMLLGNTPSSSDPDAFKLIAYAPSPADDSSVIFCFGSIDQCRAMSDVGPGGLGANGIGPSVAPATAIGVPQMVPGGKIYVSDKYIRLSPDLQVTILGRVGGQDAAETVMISPRGVPPTLPNLGGVSPPPGLGQPLGTPLPGQGPFLPNPPSGSLGSNDDVCYKAPDAATCQTEVAIARLVNDERQRAGLNPLTLDRKISYVARLWSAEQARLGQISHDWFNNGYLAEAYQTEFREPSPIFAENVAMNSCGGGPEELAAQFMDQWMNSSGHRQNILSPGRRTIGIGFAKSSGGCYATQDFG